MRFLLIAGPAGKGAPFGLIIEMSALRETTSLSGGAAIALITGLAMAMALAVFRVDGAPGGNHRFFKIKSC